MGAHAGLLDQQQVAGQGHGLGALGNPGEAEEAGGRPFVGEAAFGQLAVLGVEHHGEVEGRRVLQRAAQGAVVVELDEAVAEGHAAGVAQRHQFGQLLAGEILAQRADGEHLGVPGLAGAVEDQLGDRRGVEHRLGQRRAAQAGDAAGGGGQGLAGDAALAAVARLAQGHGEVDQPGRGDQALGVEAAFGDEAGRRLADAGDLGILDIQVGDLVEAAGRIDDAGAEDVGAHQFCSSDS
ncbi:hypothetical protein D9M68_731230 [compost metagenome]